MSIRRILRAACLGLALTAGGCVAAPPPAPPVNWAQAPVVLVSISVGFFHPGTVTLRLNQPVRLVFENADDRPHDFVTRLFSTVSQRPGFRTGSLRVILQTIESVEYDIIPRVPGTYSIYTVMFEPPNGIQPARIVVK